MNLLLFPFLTVVPSPALGAQGLLPSPLLTVWLNLLVALDQHLRTSSVPAGTRQVSNECMGLSIGQSSESKECFLSLLLCSQVNKSQGKHDANGQLKLEFMK